MLKNLACALFLTERETDEFDENAPKIKGRIVTTLAKAKEVRPLVEKCVTIARKGLAAEDNAEQFDTDAEPGSDAWKKWREGEQWQKWNAAIAPSVAARRRLLQLVGDKEAVRVLFEKIAPRFADRNGGYTRILRLAKPRLGDAGTRAILEFVGTHDRVVQRSQKPAFESQPEPEARSEPETQPAAETTEENAGEESAS
jgi:large subunit ribosomal protein L17